MVKAKNIWNTPENKCGYCDARIRDWKIFCNQRCYDKGQERTLEIFQEIEDDEEFERMIVDYSDEDCQIEGHDHPRNLQCEEHLDYDPEFFSFARNERKRKFKVPEPTTQEID